MLQPDLTAESAVVYLAFLSRVAATSMCLASDATSGTTRCRHRFV